MCYVPAMTNEGATHRPPWAMLKDWDIIGMNHYRDPDGNRRLFVAMVKGKHWIKEEGRDDVYLWNRLWHKAQDIDDGSSP